MNAKQIAKGIYDGIASVPGGVYYSVVRTVEGSGLAGSDLKARNEYETERFMRLVKSAISREEPIRKLITIVITDFYSKLDESGKQAVNDKIGYGAGRFGGRAGAQFIVAQYIAKRILAGITTAEAFKRFVRVGSSFSLNILLIQGLIEESARASRRMRVNYPQTYIKVSPMNLDMVYFLVEKLLEPYLKFINSHPVTCKEIQHDLCKILSN